MVLRDGSSSEFKQKLKRKSVEYEKNEKATFRVRWACSGRHNDRHSLWCASAECFGSHYRISTVNVQVTEGNPNNIFASPRDGSETVSSLVNVVTNYSQAKRLDFYLTYKDESGNTQRVDLPSYSPANDAGTYNFDLDVSPYGFGEFVLHTSVTGLDNVTSRNRHS